MSSEFNIEQLYARSETMLNAVDALNLPSKMNVRQSTLPDTGQTVYYIYVVQDGKEFMIGSVFDIDVLDIDFEGLAKIFSFAPTWISFLVAKLLFALEEIEGMEDEGNEDAISEKNEGNNSVSSKLNLVSFLTRDVYAKAKQNPDLYALDYWMPIINLLIDTKSVGLWQQLEESIE